MTMYVGVEEGGVARSLDRGQSFELLKQGGSRRRALCRRRSAKPQTPLCDHRRGILRLRKSRQLVEQIKRGFCRSYTVPLFVAAETSRVFTAAAAGPPPFWSTGPSGADAVMFRSLDAGESFEALGDDALPERGMVMRFRADPENEGDFFAVTTEGSVIRTREMVRERDTDRERLPPAYDWSRCPSRRRIGCSNRSKNSSLVEIIRSALTLVSLKHL